MTKKDQWRAVFEISAIWLRAEPDGPTRSENSAGPGRGEQTLAQNLPGRADSQKTSLT